MLDLCFRVVEEETRTLGPEMVENVRPAVCPANVDTDGISHGVGHQRRVVRVGQVDRPNPVSPGAGHAHSNLRREARLADTAGTGERDDPARPEKRAHQGGLAIAPEKGVGRPHEVVPLVRKRSNGRELAAQPRTGKLEQAHGLIEVAQAKAAHACKAQVIPELDACGRLSRDQHLATVGSADDASRLVDGEGHVIAIVGRREPAMHSHSHADFVSIGPPLGPEQALARGASTNGIRRVVESDEAAVPFGVNLLSAKGCPPLAQQGAVAFEHIGVAFSEALQQPRRTLDVAKHERHGPRRQVPVAHRSIITDPLGFD